VTKLQRQKPGWRIHPVVLIVCFVAVTTLFVLGCMALAKSDVQTTHVRPANTSKPTIILSPGASPSSVGDTLEDQIYAFESAWLISDAAERRTAMKPFVTPHYLETQPTKNGTSPAEKADLELVKTLNPLYSAIDAEVEDDAMFVTSKLSVATTREGAVVNTLIVAHDTVWIKQSEQWLVYEDQ